MVSLPLCNTFFYFWSHERLPRFSMSVYVNKNHYGYHFNQYIILNLVLKLISLNENQMHDFSFDHHWNWWKCSSFFYLQWWIDLKLLNIQFHMPIIIHFMKFTCLHCTDNAKKKFVLHSWQIICHTYVFFLQWENQAQTSYMNLIKKINTRYLGLNHVLINETIFTISLLLSIFAIGFLNKKKINFYWSRLFTKIQTEWLK